MTRKSSSHKKDKAAWPQSGMNGIRASIFFGLGDSRFLEICGHFGDLRQGSLGVEEAVAAFDQGGFALEASGRAAAACLKQGCEGGRVGFDGIFFTEQ